MFHSWFYNYTYTRSTRKANQFKHQGVATRPKPDNIRGVPGSRVARARNAIQMTSLTY